MHRLGGEVVLDNYFSALSIIGEDLAACVSRAGAGLHMDILGENMLVLINLRVQINAIARLNRRLSYLTPVAKEMRALIKGNFH